MLTIKSISTQHLGTTSNKKLLQFFIICKVTLSKIFCFINLISSSLVYFETSINIVERIIKKINSFFILTIMDTINFRTQLCFFSLISSLVYHFSLTFSFIIKQIRFLSEELLAIYCSNQYLKVS